ncbi:MAG: putative porin [Acidobacteria bacterium]|nr:putative porin [Acidobacteriota bacterium]
MRRKWMGMVVLGMLLAALVFASGEAARSATPPAPAKSAGKSAGAETAKKEAVTPANPAAAKSEKAAARETSAVEVEIQQLRELLLEQAKELEAQRAALREQQEKMEALAGELRAVRSHSPAASASAQPGNSPVSLEAVAQGQEELGNKVGKIEKDLSETKKSLEGRLKGFGPFSFSGDMRVRYENAFGGRATNVSAGVAQHRERFRLRLNANAKFNEEVSGGLSLASGDLNNPISANQTFGTLYLRKPIAIDKAFVTYSPRWFKPLSVTAGKFAYTWYRTELAWDNDLNPEGLSESVHWNWKDSFLQHLGIVAFQTPFNESVSVGGAAAPTPSGAVFGGQVQTNWKLHERLKLGAYAAYYHYRNPDQIAQNQGSVTGSTGVLGGNSNTNYTGVVNGQRFFASQFGVLDMIARLDADTGISRFPLMLLFNYAQNTQACSNGAAFTSAGATAPFCDPRERHAYWSEAQFGRTQEQGDVRFGYTFMRIERDAVPSAFNFDDKRQATNIAQHRFEVFYQAYKNITVGMTGFLGKQLVTATSPTASVTPERYLRRFQFDFIYKF